MPFLAFASLLSYFLVAAAVLIDDASLLRTDTFDFIIVGGTCSSSAPAIVD
jgi:hypothetical protein